MSASLPAPVRTFLERHCPGDGIPPLRPLRGDGSSRAFWRLSHAGRSWVLAHNPATSDAARAENRWQFIIHEILSQRGVEVPLLRAADPDMGVWLMEDLGDRHLCDEDLTSIQEQYRRAIEYLVRMQTGSDPLRGHDRTVPHPSYDATFVLHHEAMYFHEELVHRHRGWTNPWEEIAPDCARLAEAAFTDLHSRVLMHRDYQSRNLMVTPEGRLVVIDYQGARRGPPEYDLAALLYDPYADLPPVLRTEMILAYRREMDQAGDDAGAARSPGAPLGDLQARERSFRLRLRANAANRLMQALGAFAKLGGREGRPGFLEHIPTGLRLLGEVLDGHDDCPALLTLVQALSQTPR